MEIICPNECIWAVLCYWTVKWFRVVREEKIQNGITFFVVLTVDGFVLKVICLKNRWKLWPLNETSMLQSSRFNSHFHISLHIVFFINGRLRSNEPTSEWARIHSGAFETLANQREYVRIHRHTPTTQVQSADKY